MMPRLPLALALGTTLAFTVACSDSEQTSLPTGSTGSGAGGSTSTGSNIASRWLQIDSGTSERLNAVWAAAPDDVWAMGEGVVVHYDGFDWLRIEPEDLPDNTYSVAWKSITGTGPGDVWAVGTQSQQSGPVLMHYDGSSWSSVIAKEDALGGETYELFGVAAAGGGLWVADSSLGSGDAGHGYYYDGVAMEERVEGEMHCVAASGDEVFFGMGGGQVMHYDGSEWSSPAIEDLGLRDDLTGAHAVSPAAVWLVGPEKRVHYDGTDWTMTRDVGEAYGVWGAAADDVWLVGEAFEHYDGSTWKVGTPPVDVIFRGVHGTAAEDIWAVGDDGSIAHLGG